MIDNVVLIVTGTLHERDVNELLEKCHPLGMFDRYSGDFFIESVEWRSSYDTKCSFSHAIALHLLQLLKICASFTDWFWLTHR